jgi:hypothetical protein
MLTEDNAMWLRLSDELPEDPKWRSMPFWMRAAWIELLCLACKQNKRGLVCAPNAKGLREILHLGPKRLDQAVAYWTENDMAIWQDEGTAIFVTHYAARQYLAPEDADPKPAAKDPTAAKRKQEQREREKAAQNGHDVTPDVTVWNRDSHADVTADVTPDSCAPANQKAEAEGRYAEKAGLAEAEAGADPLTPCKAEGSALPALPFAHKCADTASALPQPELEASPPTPQPERSGLLTNFDVADLQKSGWTLPEIDWGEKILLERKTLPDNPRAVLHKSVLPEVRAGRRPKAQERMNLPTVVNGGAQAEAEAEAKRQRLAMADAAMAKWRAGQAAKAQEAVA